MSTTFGRELGRAVAAAGSGAATPLRLVLLELLERRLETIAARAHPKATMLPFRPAYSVKTNPRPAFLRAARAAGFLAETISPAEVAAAREAGYPCGDIIYNGPRPCRRAELDAPLGAAFADSLEALALYLAERPAALVGVRLRPAAVPSRFGIPFDEVPDAAALMRAAEPGLTVGASMHVRSEDYRPRTWLELAGSFVDSAAALARESGRSLAVLDLGGGWTPASLERVLEHDVPALRLLLGSVLPGLTTVIVEPGQSVSTPCEALLCSVLEVRAGRGEAVVDAGFSELPHLETYPHRMYWAADGMLAPVERGAGRILGPLCLEYDVVARDVALPDGLAPGDRL
ncbi:MAG: hypothetical protein GIX03_15195, partial [Candidatus Eremiobacteraeota bacterium]|nr:hypothetical protein [Candidatus Eremiobacteraeota bacterium]